MLLTPKVDQSDSQINIFLFYKYLTLVNVCLTLTIMPCWEVMFDWEIRDKVLSIFQSTIQLPYEETLLWKSVVVVDVVVVVVLDVAVVIDVVVVDPIFAFVHFPIKRMVTFYNQILGKGITFLIWIRRIGELQKF